MGLFDDIGKDVSNAFSSGNSFSDIGNFVGKGVQGIGNFFGFNNRASWQNDGGVFKWIDEGFGELTGRNQSRASLNFAKDQYADAQKQASDLIAQQQWNKQQGDMQASQAARAATTSGQNSGPTYTSSTPLGVGSSGSGGKDFLGL